MLSVDRCACGPLRIHDKADGMRPDDDFCGRRPPERLVLSVDPEEVGICSRDICTVGRFN